MVKLKSKEIVVKIRIDEVVQTMVFIDGSFYLEIDNEAHLEEVLNHLVEYWDLHNKVGE